MHEFAPLIAELHRAELLREAEADRRSQLARRAAVGTAGWRRGAGRVVDAASHALEAAARRLDPGLHAAERRLDLVH